MGGDGMGWVGMGGDGWIWVGGGKDANVDWQELLPVYVHVKSKDPETHPSPPIDPEPVLFANQINMTSLLCLFNSQKTLGQVPVQPQPSIPSPVCILPWIPAVHATKISLRFGRGG